MAFNAEAVNGSDQPEKVQLRRYPDKCPICGKLGHPDFRTALLSTAKRRVHAAFRCPNHDCGSLYVAIYEVVDRKGPNANDCNLLTTSLAILAEKVVFAESIEVLSPLFSLTYNQALIAEKNGLDQICGPGYRKALEFLIKDFLTNHVYKGDSAKQETVKKLFLGAAIENHIAEDRIKKFAQRAVWIGNDETHYTRKWEDKDISDLKALIRITGDYIDLTIESDRYLSEMPEPKK